MRIASILTAGALALLSAGCFNLTMKPPSQDVDRAVLEVRDYKPSQNKRVAQLGIGKAEVRGVAGTPIHPPGLTAYGRMPAQDKWSYTFQLHEGNGQLRAECEETQGDVRYVVVGDIMLDVRCSCFEGETRVASLNVTSGLGEVVLPGNAHYAVKESRTSQQGHRSRSVLGYQLEGPGGQGGIDVTRAARAYLPARLEAAQRLPLLCVYAGLLLHRPTK